jgi:transposase
MFHLVAVDARGQVLERRKLPREKLQQYTSTQRSSLIGMEALAGAHYLGRRLLARGHYAPHPGAVLAAEPEGEPQERHS